MNAFEENFFRKYVHSGQTIRMVIHKHCIDILGKIIILLSIAFIPAFLYYYSIGLQIIFPFVWLKYLFIIVYIMIIYKIFDWYSDVWIITNEGITDLRWSLLRSNMNNVSFQNIEGLGVEKKGLIDRILNKGDIVLHKIGTDTFTLNNVYNPYRYVEAIEAIGGELQNRMGSNINNEKFNMVLDNLGGVVEEYLGKKTKPVYKNETSTHYWKHQEGVLDIREYGK